MNLDDYIKQLTQKRIDLGIQEGTKVWMINSTKQGGGVAEMMPTMLEIFQAIGVDVHWEVISTDNFAFFNLTKRLHNSIHGSGCAEYTDEDAQLHEAINVENHARHFADLVSPEDIVVIHDPQPMPLGNRFHANPKVWRCHIGLDHETPETKAAWDYLQRYAQDYDVAVFSLEEYIPACFSGRTELISPAIDPRSDKNKSLRPTHKAAIFQSLGFDPTAPYFLQVSRWDKLKGWKELVDTFNRAWLEQSPVRHSDFRLVLAGPDPSAVADDPEGIECYENTKKLVEHYTSFYGTPIEMLSLDMSSREKNAMMVNALQQEAAVVVQNSIQEGFGLTVTEAMWKSKPVLGSTAAGIKRQIVDGKNGWICSLPWHLKHHIVQICLGKYDLKQLGQNARATVEREFLVFKQVERYLEIFQQVANNAGRV